jgi:HlyD family secretion protein
MRGTRTVGVVVILAVAAAGLWFQQSRSPAQSAGQAIRTAQVTRGTLTVSVTASGTLQPYAQVEVRSRATGTVMDIRVHEGDRVTKGQVLAVIDDTDAQAGYETSLAQAAAAQAKLTQAQQQLASTRAQDAAALRQAEDALRTAQAKLAQVLAGSRPEEVDQARAALQQAQSAAGLARAQLERSRTLYAQGLIARQDVDQAQNADDVAAAQARAAQAKLSQLQAGNAAADIAVARAQVREAESAVAAARARQTQEAALGSAVTSAQADVRISQANLGQAAERLGESRVVASINGIVASLAVQVGQTVIGGSSAGGTLLMTLADTRVLQGSIAVDESDIAHIRVGMPVRITVDALPGRTFTGSVARIAPQSTVTQNVTQFNVIVTVENPDRALRLGMSADGEFIAAERRNVLLVPAAAVRGTKAKVVQVVQGEALVPTTVETGASDGRQIEIVRGLDEGQTVYLGPAGGASGQPSSGQPVNPFMPQPQGGRR